MAVKFVLTLLIVALFGASTFAQVTPSISLSISPSITITPSPASPSLTPSPFSPSLSASANSQSGTNSISTSNSNSNSNSNTNSNSNSYSNSISSSITYTPSTTLPIPPPPTGLVNVCLRPAQTNHATYLCLAWSDGTPTGRAASWTVAITPQGQAAQSFSVPFSSGPSFRINGLSPKNTYGISITAVGSSGLVSTPLTGSFTTGLANPKTNPSVYDLHNPTCVEGVSTTTYRKIITCTWGAPPTAPKSIHLRCRCKGSSGQKGKRIHLHLKGTATTGVLKISRSSATCFIEIVAFYPPTVIPNKGGQGHVYHRTVNVTP